MKIDTELRQHLVSLLTTDWAHVTLEDGIEGIPAENAASRLPGKTHTLWQLLEHLRICQWDLLEYSRNPKHISPEFPKGLWPESVAPPSDQAWETMLRALQDDLKAMVDLVSVPSIDLFAPFPWSKEGHTLLREALILADHNAYHLGQVIQLLKAMKQAGR